MTVGAALPLAATGGLTIDAPHPLETGRAAEVVILPGWREADEPVAAEIVVELSAAAARGAVVVGLCLGAFRLAEAGLLDGKRATTHWARVATIAARYPAVTVDPGALFVDEGGVFTSAGIAAGLDCCLQLLAPMSGVAETNRVARHLVVAPQRAGEQPQLIERPALGSSTDRRGSEILEALRANPRQTPSLDDLAARVGMSRRSLTRHMCARTGGSLGE